MTIGLYKSEIWDCDAVDESPVLCADVLCWRLENFKHYLTCLLISSGQGLGRLEAQGSWVSGFMGLEAQRSGDIGKVGAWGRGGTRNLRDSSNQFAYSAVADQQYQNTVGAGI